MSDQPNTQSMRERLTKLFEFLRAYTDLRFPPVRDIAQQPRSLWLKELPPHPSVELFRDTGKAEEEIADSDIVLRLTRPSVYELAQIAFGGVIRLTEHFRCAPNIIVFSNNLSYKGEIKALREASSIPLTPHVVHYRVQGGRDRGDNINEVEAETIASLICAAMEQPEFTVNHEREPTSFGVVSLVGDKQAMKIDATSGSALNLPSIAAAKFSAATPRNSRVTSAMSCSFPWWILRPHSRHSLCVKKGRRRFSRNASTSRRAVLAIRCGLPTV